jgi:hypothetical protein
VQSGDDGDDDDDDDGGDNDDDIRLMERAPCALTNKVRQRGTFGAHRRILMGIHAG